MSNLKNDLLKALSNLGTPTAYDIDGIGTVYIKKLTVEEQGKLMHDKGDDVKSSLRLVTFSVCDEEGERVFAENDIKDLGKMHADTLTKLIEAIREVNGFYAKVDDLKKD